jgi:hypothetical protein
MEAERTKKCYPSFFFLVLKMFGEEEEYDCLDILFFHFLDREHEGCDRRMDTGVTYII